ncbi:hypothetical protein EBQ34_14155 [Vandammella animalimorsus]|uniref:Uncharacterized protein n=1 Tax=Vandammella animalimorsus TaxID=2029117 RepID=A0A3M6R195_9BURK|nr:hypothetical protein EBQ34_14155 [Vandammella animalimorsus]
MSQGGIGGNARERQNPTGQVDTATLDASTQSGRSPKANGVRGTQGGWPQQDAIDQPPFVSYQDLDNPNESHDDTLGNGRLGRPRDMRSETDQHSLNATTAQVRPESEGAGVDAGLDFTAQVLGNHEDAHHRWRAVIVEENAFGILELPVAAFFGAPLDFIHCDNLQQGRADRASVNSSSHSRAFQ